MPVSTKKSRGLCVARKLTAHLVTVEGHVSPLDAMEWERRTALIKNTDGSVVFEMSNVEVPQGWSQFATDIVASKYFRKAGVPVGTGTGAETSVKQLVSRIVQAITVAGQRQEYFASVADADIFRDELTFLLVTQRAAFNSPVWFNVGLKEAYGLTGDAAGSWRWNGAIGECEPVTDSYTYPQVSACFIQSIQDDLMDIAEHVKREMRIFKYGSGAGANFSALRGNGEKLSAGGSSSGLLSFLEIFDRAAGAIKSGGTTRRAAKMVVVDVDHPDIEEFIAWKVREEGKVRALIAAGYAPGLNGEAIRTVSGQNANNSVRVTDEFMQAVLDGGKFSTIYRTTGAVADVKDARTVMTAIADATWRCADPGMQFDSTANRWHTCKATGRINGSNPCAEFMFVDDSACNLASLNLVKFMQGETGFDVGAFEHACRVIFMAQEILVDHASYPAREIAQNSHDYRPLGIGYANLGALLMRWGIPYDSDLGRNRAAHITALMTGTCYALSAEMAAFKGPFSVYAPNAESMMAVMEMHRSAVNALPVGNAFSCVSDAAKRVWDSAVVSGRKHGYRNAQASLLAPTGTIGFLMDCDTTGVEPDFALVKTKKLAGGGTFKIVNQSVGHALARLGYQPEQAKKILAHLTQREQIEGAPQLKEEHLPVFDCASRCGDGVRYIQSMGHVRMMAAVQPFLSGAISKTVNVPESESVEGIERLYMEAWRQGIKAIAVYRHNSKACQVLTGRADAVSGRVHKRVRLPKKRLGFTQEARVGGQKVYVRTGEYEDGALGEIFVDIHKEGATMRSVINCFAIAISLGLQHGVPLENFVKAFCFSNFAPNGMVQDHPNIKHASSIVDYVFRLLAFEYLGRHDIVQIPPQDIRDSDVVLVPVVPSDPVTVDGTICNVCGGLTRRSGTCSSCDNCGSQTGCA